MTDDLVKRLRARQEFEFIDGYKRVQWEDEVALEAADRIEELEAKLAEAVEALRFSFDTLGEINPSNYSHDDVCLLNDRSVEVILYLNSTLAELKGETDSNILTDDMMLAAAMQARNVAAVIAVLEGETDE